MTELSFDNTHQRLVNITDTSLMIFLIKKENVLLRIKLMKLIFKSHSILSSKSCNFVEWSNKVIFFDYLDNFIDYLTLLENK